LAEARVNNLYVLSEDLRQLGSSVLASVNDQDDVPPAERYAALQLAMAVEIEHAARLVDCGPYVTIAERLGQELTSVLSADKVLPGDLFRLARHDFNTFTHVTNVAGYAILLAERLEICSGNELEQLASAAILHDLGKRFIPADILTKPARLDPDERAVIETHPQRGYEELCQRPDLSFDQLMMVYQHHERVDGKGYPVGLQGDEIHPWARMLAVVDVFDAMTGIRPYRRPATAQEAMRYIQQSSGTHFDPEVVACWCTAMTRK
jgi:HD-GYP domain-containing protein (c-di-GMP phosphodiesterase class II)